MRKIFFIFFYGIGNYRENFNLLHSLYHIWSIMWMDSKNKGEIIFCIFTSCIAPKSNSSNYHINFFKRQNRRKRVKKGIKRKCPYCAEVVKTEAIVCKHCGRDIGKECQFCKSRMLLMPRYAFIVVGNTKLKRLKKLKRKNLFKKTDVQVVMLC